MTIVCEKLTIRGIAVQNEHSIHQARRSDRRRDDLLLVACHAIPRYTCTNCRVVRSDSESWSKQTDYCACLTRAVHWQKPANPVQFGTVPARLYRMHLEASRWLLPQRTLESAAPGLQL
jgi:hypothetical protein